ncbi:hypothetical protein GCM10020331_049870 [Ectobacillus funiculus]
MRIPYVKKHAAFSDREVTRWNDILKDWDGAEALIGPVILGVPLSKSSISHSGASFAPHAIRRMLGLYTTYHIEDEKGCCRQRTIRLRGYRDACYKHTGEP